MNISSTALKALFVSTVILASLPAYSDCVFELTVQEKAHISATLAPVPRLRELILEMSVDPDVHANIRALLKKALLNDKIEFVNLTKELRQEYQIPDSFLALSNLRNFPTYSSVDNPQLTDNEEVALVLQAPEAQTLRVFVQDENEKGLLSLIHELAHVRLDGFLAKHFDKLCERLPYPFVARFPETGCHFHHQFLDFLQEKFAHETHVRVLGENWAKYFPNNDADVDIRMALMQGQARTQEIAMHVAVLYNITSPEIFALAPLSVSEILMAGRGVQEIARASQFCSRIEDQTGLMCGLTNQAVVRILLALLDGDTNPRIDSMFANPRALRSKLIELTGKQDGEAKVRATLKQAIAFSVTGSRQNRERLLELAQNELRETFRKAGWDLPEEGGFSWRQFTRAAPN